MEEMDVNSFKNVPKSIISFLERVLEELQRKPLPNDKARMIELAIVNLKYNPITPINDVSISFDQSPVTYSIFYGSYKIEISVDVSENEGHGYDHNKRFVFQYEADGYIEEEGDWQEFENEFLGMLENVPVENICISDEE